MDYDTYRKAYFIDPVPKPRFCFTGAFGATLYFEDYPAAIAFYELVLGPPAYVEGAGTRGWPIGSGWLTLLAGKQGNPRNIEITLELATPEEAESLQQEFLAAGAVGSEPADRYMYVPVRVCPVVDPFGLEIMIVSRLAED